MALANPSSPIARRHWVDDPYAPHVTEGTLLRVGSAVGGVRVDSRKYTGIGGMIALGRRQGRLSFDAEYTMLVLQDPGPSSIELGRAHQLAAVGRVDVLRLGPHIVGGNSMIALFTEAGLARTFYRYAMPRYGETPREVPADNSRTQVEVGMGLFLDHRLEQPLGFPNRIGWQLGWRLAASPRATRDEMVACRGCIASPNPTTPVEAYDTEMLLTSTLDFTW
ncbi:MAG: hypothetical protein K8W52_02010 [Deltaproteobacteria bacterium]|nr:hypothetical protein [Deltaproteobacteria bacterium]